MKEFVRQIRLKQLVISLLIGCSVVFLSVRNAKAQPGGVGDGGGGFCPASQHTCDFGTIGFSAPDPFDAGAGCDHSYLAYTNDPSRDQDGNGIADDSCYGGCDLQYNMTGSVPFDCYTNCQVGGNGTSGYTGCLRGAFGLGPRPQPVSIDPRNTPSFAGNVLRLCLVGNVPAAFTDQYNSCIVAGNTVEICCAEIANNFP